ncbi:MAG: UDP-N-acetylmuramyl-tripeptide synthetase, partial [Candidatus Harrisonbacteria bacterium]|nr:UDP-N-acetylmuramyl-tripeptide synthetase [Candidatus Harrisonbacteria bacterium]
KRLYHYLLAWFGSLWFSRPSKKLYVIGVTGTKGKSSTIELLSSIFDAAGKKTAALSTVHRKIGAHRSLNSSGNTMPGRFQIQRFFRDALEAGCEYAFLEVTSQGVVQHRHRFIDFDAAALTGLHPEHIESHGSFENYREAKVGFFRYTAKYSDNDTPLFFIPKDDETNTFFFKAAATRGRVIEFSHQDFLERLLKGDRKQLGPWFESDFNLSNAALASEIALSQNIPWMIVAEALKNFHGVPGRLEYISGKVADEKGQSQDVQVVIDYAHTPGSLEAVYSFLRKKLEGSPGNLICVFGSAGGGRDKWKRPLMGEVADKYCDRIILTSEDPYDENPKEIVDAIRSGIAKTEKVEEILDRKEAMQTAVKKARGSDIVTITGMGSQAWFYGEKGAKLPWSERKVIEEVFVKE